MKILAVSDLHGNLPSIQDPCDLFLIAGDVCPDASVDDQRQWLDGKFRRWLTHIPAQHIVGIAGNHDFVFEKGITDLQLPWEYLRDTSVEIEGLKIYGLPWVPNLPAWAFYAKDHELSKIYGDIPLDTDIVLSHGPPHMYGDRLWHGSQNVGCKWANEMIAQVKPKAFVCGHIHEGFGSYRCDDTTVWNISFVNEFYQPFWDRIIEIDLSDDVNSDAQQKQTDPEREIHSPTTHT